MSKRNKCKVYVKFESESHQIRLGEGTIFTLNCSADSRLFPYLLRRKLHEVKRIPPYEQEWTKLSSSSNKLEYKVKHRERDQSQLLPLTIHGHHGNECKLQIDRKDRVIDIKFMLSPLAGSEAENIQLNYNTMRRLNDDEVMFDTDCLKPSIVIMFWFEFANKNPGESPIYQSVPKLIDINPIYPNVGATIRKVCKKYGPDGRGTFGYRKYLDKQDFNKRGEYQYIDYEIINNRIDTISCALKYELGLNKDTMVGLCSINRKEWLLCDYSCAVQSIVTVPLYPTLDGNALEYITNHASLKAIFTDYLTVKDIIALLPKCKSLKYIVLFDDELPDKMFLASEEGRELLNKYDDTIKVLSDLENTTSDDLKKGKYKVQDVTPADDDLYTIMYTSGTTGPPKGVMLTHFNMMSVLNGYLDVENPDDEEDGETVHLSYLPLAHSMERALNMVMLIRGYKIGFFSGSVDRLVEDMTVIKPVAFFGVPRVFQKIQDTVMNGIREKGSFIQWLFNYAYNNKVNAINNRVDGGGFMDKYIFSKIFWSKIKGAFGGNIRFIGSGSAPLSKELTEFLKVALAEVVGEGYGLTETTTGGTGTHPFDLKYGHVGQPRINIQMKLVDVEDMGYLTTDKPCPRGEIWLRGPTIFKGYYKNKAKTDEVLFKDGWFATGDVGLWREEGRLQIIDRKKNICM